MPYEMYKRTGSRVGSPAISVVPDGRIALNSAAARVFHDAGVKAVVLFWDKAAYRIAFKGAAKGDKNSYAVSIAPNLHSGSLRAKSFMAYVGWAATAREMLPAQWNEKEAMLEVAIPAQFLASGAAPPTKRKGK
jgi:hypothetical protein